MISKELIIEFVNECIDYFERTTTASHFLAMTPRNNARAFAKSYGFIAIQTILKREIKRE